MKTSVACILVACDQYPYWWTEENEVECLAAMKIADAARNAALDAAKERIDLPFSEQMKLAFAALQLPDGDSVALGYLRDHNDAGNARLAALPGWRAKPTRIRPGYGMAGIQYRTVDGETRMHCHSGRGGDFGITRLC